MFTGIIQRMGVVEAIERSGGHGRLRVAAGSWSPAIELGESVAIEGVCLTVAEERAHILTFDVLQETFERTNLGDKKRGQRINLERALRVGDALGGHFVTGHVDGVGRVRKIAPLGRDWVLEVTAPPDLIAQLVRKGSVAVSGVSLTIVDLTRETFTVHLIPHTWHQTSLSALQPGDAVNLETDMIGKYVQRFLSARA